MAQKRKTFNAQCFACVLYSLCITNFMIYKMIMLGKKRKRHMKYIKEMGWTNFMTKWYFFASPRLTFKMTHVICAQFYQALSGFAFYLKHWIQKVSPIFYVFIHHFICCLLRTIDFSIRFIIVQNITKQQYFSVAVITIINKPVTFQCLTLFAITST